jgi:hypothetical protein
MAKPVCLASKTECFEVFYARILREASVKSRGPIFWRWFVVHALMPTPNQSAWSRHAVNRPECKLCFEITVDSKWPTCPKVSSAGYLKRGVDLYESTQSAKRPKFAQCRMHFSEDLMRFEQAHPVVGSRKGGLHWKNTLDWRHFIEFCYKWHLSLRTIPFLIDTHPMMGLSLFWAFDEKRTELLELYQPRLRTMDPPSARQLGYDKIVKPFLADTCNIRSSGVDVYVKHLWTEGEPGMAFPVHAKQEMNRVMMFGIANLAANACVHHRLTIRTGGQGFDLLPCDVKFTMGSLACVSYGNNVDRSWCKCITCDGSCNCSYCITYRSK